MTLDEKAARNIMSERIGKPLGYGATTRSCAPPREC